MSFSNRLTLFFLVIVVLPMAGTAFLLFRVSGQMETRSADAISFQSLQSAANLYQRDQRISAQRAAEISEDPQMRMAWQRGEAALKRYFKAQISRDTLTSVSLFSKHGNRLWQRGSLGLHQIRLEYEQPNDISALVLTFVTPQKFINTASQLTGHQMLLKTDAGVLGQKLSDEYHQNSLRLNAKTTLSVFVSKGEGSPLESQPLLAFAFIALLLLALFLALVLRHSMQGQIQRMVTTAKRIGSGDFSASVPATGKDEMSELANEFNRMSMLLEHRESDLREQRRELEHSIHYLGQAVASGLDREASLKIILQGMVDACHAECAQLLMHDQSQEQQFQVGEQIADGDQVGNVYQELASRNYDKAQIHASEVGVWRGLATSILDSENMIQGRVSLARRGRPFSSAEIDLLSYLARQASFSLENISLHQLVAEQALTDELTNINNRRNFDRLLAKECERADRFDHALSLLLLDIDDFKEVNDKYGHLAGDKVLQGLGDLLGQLSRSVDECARYGGEEFAVILPETLASEALLLAERLRQQVEQKEIIYQETSISITVSIGVATMPDGLNDPHALLAHADQALYQAKRSGKNRSISYTNE